MNGTHLPSLGLAAMLLMPSLAMARVEGGVSMPEESRPIASRISGIRTLAQGRFAVAFPGRLGPGSVDALAGAKTGTENYELLHSFGDGSALTYYGAWGGDSSSLHVHHGRTGKESESDAELRYFDDQGDGYASHAMSYYEGLIEGDVWMSRGRSLWGSYIEGAPGDAPFEEAMVSTFSTFYDVDSWGYASEDFTYTVGDAYRYEGGGAYGEGGLDQSFFASVELSIAGLPYAICESDGEVLSEPEAGQGFSTEARDSCRQLIEGGGYWESWVFASNLYTEDKGWVSVYSQEILCSGEEGEELRYAWESDGDGKAGYVESGSGEMVDFPDCAWDPTLEMSTY